MGRINGNSSRETRPGARKAKDAGRAEHVERDLSIQNALDINPRLAKILLLQRAIADGCYAIPASAVAEKMVETLLIEKKEPIASTVLPRRREYTDC